MLRAAPGRFPSMVLPFVAARYPQVRSGASDDFLADLPGIAEAVFDGTPVLLAYAYGSRVKGTATARSDLDLGEYADRASGAAPLPVRDEMMLADRLSRQLGVDVDLRNLGTAPLEWRAAVLREGVCVYSRDERVRVELERETLLRWFDEQPRFQQFHESRLNAFAASGLRGAAT